MKTYQSLTILLVLLVTLFFFNCSSVKETKTIEHITNDTNTITNLKPEVSLINYLRRVSGVMVKGTTDENSIVYIRTGGNSLTNSSEPMFLVNGMQFNGDVRMLSRTISVSDIASVKVYKNASETAFYGMRGANGVIDVLLKTK